MFIFIFICEKEYFIHSFIDSFTHWFIQPTGSAMTHILHFLHRNSTKNQICCSQTPLCYLQMENFSSNSLISCPLPTMFFQILNDIWMIYFLNYPWINFAEATIKFDSLSDLIRQTFTPWPVNLLKHMTKESVFNEY